MPGSITRAINRWIMQRARHGGRIFFLVEAFRKLSSNVTPSQTESPVAVGAHRSTRTFVVKQPCE